MILVNLWYDDGLLPKVEVHEDKTSKKIDLEEISNKYLSQEKYCIGYDIGGEFKPHGILLNKGYQCDECKKRDIFLPCSRCNGSKCISNYEKAREWCNQEFKVYLAYFGGKYVKVGVAASKRLKIRLIEQGAIAYKVYKVVKNGMEARRIETQLKKRFPDKVMTYQKIKLYKNVNLDWMEKSYGIEEILEYNYKNIEKLNKLKEYDIKENLWIPKVIGSVGQIIITENGYFPFFHIRGRKIVNRRNLLDYYDEMDNN